MRELGTSVKHCAPSAQLSPPRCACLRATGDRADLGLYIEYLRHKTTAAKQIFSKGLGDEIDIRLNRSKIILD